MKRTMVVLALGSLVLAAGCARTSVPIDAAKYAPQEDLREPGRGSDASAARTLASQANLIAAAGSDRVLFELDSAELTLAARGVLARQAGWLRERPAVGFTIEGHCDERGTREYNLALGDRRARAVADYFMAQGVAPARLRTISYGKERPDALGSDEAGYAQNRRAVSIVLQSSAS